LPFQTFHFHDPKPSYENHFLLSTATGIKVVEKEKVVELLKKILWKICDRLKTKLVNIDRPVLEDRQYWSHCGFDMYIRINWLDPMFSHINWKPINQSISIWSVLLFTFPPKVFYVSEVFHYTLAQIYDIFAIWLFQEGFCYLYNVPMTCSKSIKQKYQYNFSVS